MNIYQAKDDQDFVDSLIQMLEQDTQKKIFTLRVLDHTVEGLETLIVFEDQSILMGMIKVQPIKGKIGLRMQGNYI
jgi:hypothetical protein